MQKSIEERLTQDFGESFEPARYALKSRNDAIIGPYKTYDLFYEITFKVIQKLGEYEDIGTPEECRNAIFKKRSHGGAKMEERTGEIND